MRQNHLSKARTWEYNLKDGAWGVDELGFSQLPYELRVRVWNEAMLTGPRCNTPAPATLDAIEAYAPVLALLEMSSGATFLADT
jgi:hypothetical protein